MGIRLKAQFLHDGRAKTPEQAIEMHAVKVRERAISFWRCRRPIGQRWWRF